MRRSFYYPFAGFGTAAGMGQGQYAGNIEKSDVKMGDQNQMQSGYSYAG